MRLSELERVIPGSYILEITWLEDGVSVFAGALDSQLQPTAGVLDDLMEQVLRETV